MKLLKIKIENFMSHSLTEVNCSQIKSALVVGRYKNDLRVSMGVGKSNFFKAIEYVLFGEAEVKLDKIIRYGADKCVVTLEFENNGKVYKVIRSRFRKGNKSEVRLYEKIQSWKDITQKTSSETENDLKKIIKISHIAFKHATVFPQADLAGLASLSPKDRKLILKEPLQISVYNKLEKIAKDKTASLWKEISTLEAQISLLGNPAEELLILEGNKNHIQKNIEDYSLLKNAKFNSLNEKLTELALLEGSNLSDLTTQLNESLLNEKSLNQRISNLQQMVNKISSVSLIQTAKDAAESKLTLDTLLLKKKMEEESPQICEDDLKNEILELIKQEIEYKSEISSLQIELKKLAPALGIEDSCEKCAQDITEEYRSSFQIKRAEEIDKNNQKLKHYSSLINDILNKKTKVQLILSQSQEKAVRLNQIISKILVQQTAYDNLMLSIKRYQLDLESKNNDLNHLIEDRQKVLSTIAVLKTKIGSLNIHGPDYHLKLKSLTSAMKKELSEIELSLNKENILLGSYVEKISSIKENITQLEQIKETLKKKKSEFSIKSKVQHAFSSQGIPTMIIHTVLDDLQIVANDLLSEIYPHIEMAFTISKIRGDDREEDTLDIVYRINGEEHEYNQLSGGQKVIIALCLRMGLSLIIQRRVGVDIKFILLDEVDSQFDEVTQEEFIKLIKKWQEKFTIFIISHNKNIKDKFTHAILIEGDDSGSTGKVVTSW